MHSSKIFSSNFPKFGSLSDTPSNISTLVFAYWRLGWRICEYYF
jgi:hypothetical protein